MFTAAQIRSIFEGLHSFPNYRSLKSNYISVDPKKGAACSAKGFYILLHRQHLTTPGGKLSAPLDYLSD